MKRYALLTGAKYYPSPGWCGFHSWHDSIDAATPIGKEKAEDEFGWWQVVDMQTGTIVAGEGSGHSGLWGEVKANPNG
jgi:hypothetical protein